MHVNQRITTRISSFSETVTFNIISRSYFDWLRVCSNIFRCYFLTQGNFHTNQLWPQPLSIRSLSYNWKNDMYQKTIFLNSDFDSHFPQLISVAPNGFDVWLRLMNIAPQCAFLDYCHIFPFICYDTCLSSQLHTACLSHSH